MNKFRTFPPINSLINDKNLSVYPLYLRNYFSKSVVLKCKKQILKDPKLEFSFEDLSFKIKNSINEFLNLQSKSLINATGVIIHTNLGRSIIDENVFEQTKDIVCSYSNLEFNINSGKRGSRYDWLSANLKILFNCEDCLIVNNNAAAVFLILNTLAKDYEVITSRSELVEIGGSFRIPEVIHAAGVKLKEIGTTNKTHLQDYKDAISLNTKIILKTHRSNFAFKGFFEEVSLEEIYNLAKKKKIISYYDLGSGWCENLNSKLTKDEPCVKDLLKYCDILSFSGDKLFGSTQAGIILGKKKYIEKLKKNQLLRMLRVDKITLAFLNETTKVYLEKKYEKIPTLKLLNDDLTNIKAKAIFVKNKIQILSDLKISKSLVGGGSMPDKSLDTFVLSFKGKALMLQENFRKKGVVGRIEKGEFVLDFRTILDKDLEKLIQIINEVFNG
ncbi:L-seryl-tRNA(Sec) selenium transferase [Campylobacter insulaenigrae]|uniref:L-seryl-tRNA(Sec) selenium transferase n=1 Tax=Campylobacter insulaenigrae TaxID=260714 RepID=UPI002153600B|nr:L-seryl-tRNA(Sec) selenium transferase [Campylobacter insulaenigrae]MCR6572439.1 L-seryl-tRNA(Sec) selenium transferase [Campylobacter insulaenigrae]MCR6574115.1 L-seryl-tRNA(Sec) selenium transferase [Campylobacter insulaenigrae]MCR6580064.1 L-seryl-tRNA(Sec) selenium transferase [Campylobacter insulaenigrae]MCR6586037.1 L-seryl-tRNA(Sec) selenium transferase [Campylobacter insulaenigrae]